MAIAVNDSILKRLYWNQHNLSWSISGQNGVDHVKWCFPLLKKSLKNLQEKLLLLRLTSTAVQAAAKFGIRNIPTILFFKDGKVADKQVGAVPKNSLVEKNQQTF